MDVLSYDKQLKKRQILYCGRSVFFKNILSLMVPYLIVEKIFFLVFSFYKDIFTSRAVLMFTYTVIQLIFLVFTLLIVINITHYSLRGESINLKPVLRSVLNKWGKATWTYLLGFLIATGLAFLLIIPGIIWLIYYTFVLQVVVFTGLKGKKALNYSKDLVKERFGDVFILQLLAIVPLIILNVSLNMSFDSIYISALQRAFAVAVNVYFTVCFTVFFENLNALKTSCKKNDFTLNKTDTTLTLKNASGFAGQEVPLLASLHSLDGKPLKDQNIHFFIYAKSIGTAITDSNGNATLLYVLERKSPGIRVVTAAFEGSDDYKKSKSTAKLELYDARKFLASFLPDLPYDKD